MVSTLIDPREPGLQAARPAGVVYFRPLFGRDARNPSLDRGHRIFGVLPQALGALASVYQRAERSIGRHDRVEPAIEQSVWNPGLLLHPRCERDEGRRGRTGIEDQVGFERQYDLKVGRVAATSDAPDLRPCADVGQQVLALFRPIRARPTDQQVGSKSIQQDGGWRACGKYALDVLRDRDCATCRIVHGDGPRRTWRQSRSSQSCHQRATVQHASVYRDHHAAGFNDRVGCLADGELHFVGRFVGNRCSHNLPTDIDSYVGGGDALLDFDDLTLELVTGAEFHGRLSIWPGAKPP